MLNKKKLYANVCIGVSLPPPCLDTFVFWWSPSSLSANGIIECPLALLFFFSVMTQFFKSGKSKLMVRLSSPVCLSFRHTLFVNCLQSSRNLNKFRKFLFTDSAFLVSLIKNFFSPYQSLIVFDFGFGFHCFQQFCSLMLWFIAIALFFWKHCQSLHTHQKRTAPKKRLSYLFLQVTIYHQPKV